MMKSQFWTPCQRNTKGNINRDAIIHLKLLFPTVLVLVFVVYSRRREAHIKYPGPDDDVRENIINYDDEGGGEDDMTAFDITPLQIPIGGPMPELTQCKMPPLMCKQKDIIIGITSFMVLTHKFLLVGPLHNKHYHFR